MPPRRRREYGTGTLTELPNGRFRCYLDAEPGPDGSRRRVSAVGSTRTEAQRRARAKLAALSAADDPTAFAHPPTVAEWAERWLDTVVRPRRSPNTFDAYETRLRVNVLPLLGRLRLDRLRASHGELLEATVLDGDPRLNIPASSPATAKLALTVLYVMCGDAVREGLMRSNPIVPAETMFEPFKRAAWLDAEGARRIIDAEPDPMWRLVWRLMFTTGLRVGELGGLRLSDLKRRGDLTVLEVSWQLKTFNRVDDERDLPRRYEAVHLTGRHWLTRPKTRAGIRFLPLPDRLAADLTAWSDAHADNPHGLLFTTRRDGPVLRESVRYRLKRACERAGVPPVSPHALRHSEATLLAEAQAPAMVRTAIVGHADASVTDRVYTHASTDALRQALDGVARLLGDA